MRFLPADSGKFRTITYTPDGRYLATGHDGGEVRVWDLATGTRAATVAPRDTVATVHAAVFSPDGTRLAVGHDHRCLLWEVDQSDSSVDFRSLGDTDTGGILTTPVRRPLGFDPAGSAVFEAEGPLLFRFPVGRDGMTRWLLSDHVHQHLDRVALHPDGRTVAVASYASDPSVWDLEWATPVDYVSPWDRPWWRWRTEFPASPGRITRLRTGLWNQIGHLIFSADGSRLMATVRGDVVVWRADTWERVSCFRASERSLITAAAISPDGRTVAVASAERLVRLHDAERGTPIGAYDFEIGAIHRLEFSPDGLTAAACGGGKRAAVWDVA